MTPPDDAASPADAAVSPKTVLIIDDDEHVRSLLVNALTEADEFTPVAVESAEEGHQHLLSSDFGVDAVLLDVYLTGVSGEEFLDWIKSAAPHIPVVILSGSRDEDMVLRCLNRGAIEFIQKPFSLDDVASTLHQAIRRQTAIARDKGEIRAEQPAQGWVELTAPSEIEYLARMQRFTEVLLQSRLPKELCEDLRMTIEEVGRNAIEWGNRFDRTKQFRISYCLLRDRIVLKFEDEGEGFHPDKLPDPTTDPFAHLAKRKEEGKRPGGFGVYLVQSIMDEVVYSERGNAVVMTKYFPAEA